MKQSPRDYIIELLHDVQSEAPCHILFAIESGSRGWGFPSPDSDYDVRFIYRKELTDYLRIEPRRDVIEVNAEFPYDVNGWDISKALFLANKANPIFLEWLQSPITYIEAPADLRDDIKSFAEHAAEMNKYQALKWHYYKLLQTHLVDYGPQMGETLPLKKYFYGLRPALMIDWILTHDHVPPMHMQALLDGLKLPNGVNSCIFDLVLVKQQTREMGIQGRVPALDQYLQAQYRRVSENLGDSAGPGEPDPSVLKAANKLFHKIVTRV